MRVKCQKYRGGGKDASEARNRNLHFAKQGYFSCIPLWFLLYYDWFSRIFCPLLRSLFAGFRQDKNKENYEFPLKMTSGQISCKMALWYGTLEKCDKLSLQNGGWRKENGSFL